MTVSMAHKEDESDFVIHVTFQAGGFISLDSRKVTEYEGYHNGFLPLREKITLKANL